MANYTLTDDNGVLYIFSLGGQSYIMDILAILLEYRCFSMGEQSANVSIELVYLFTNAQVQQSAL